MSNRQLGEIFFDGNVKLQVVEGDNCISCRGCFYNQLNGRGEWCCGRRLQLTGFCQRSFRDDGISVIFKEICR